ncbi:apoptotic chromatin condensation inducer in the nucleus isoform X2 [Halyomorpha halys]|uniref:apoptotic chromatin condensation inducer in the nucleus isoform X2 n=1 Tax=Halyomorpha halys TaxID=286706 RepID=UPI0006D527E5|nr:apoptotic chromatin condensation inducer in the nucleus isoform X2 [Halyomorpha halys]
MVRKSERNKAQGTPEKLIPERTRKSTRQALRRKKKSSSESEGEPEVVVDKDIKEQETTELKVTADDGITWKIQSSNGSGGEIQKLKICRQRVTESNDSSSPTKEASPRRRKSTRSSRNLDTPSDSSESFEVNNEVAEVKTTSEEPVIPGLENSKGTEVNNDNLTEPVPEEQAVNEKEIPDPVSSGGDVSANPEDPSIETVQCNNIEPVLQKTSSPEGVVTDCDKQNMDVDKEDVQCESAVPADEPEECNKLSEEPSDKSSAELEPTNIVEDQVERTTQESTKPDEEKITEEIISAVNSEGSPVLDKEGSTSIEKEGSIALEAEVSTALVSEGSTLLENEENTTLETEGSTSVDVEENNADDNEESTTLINEGNTAVDKEGASELVIEEITALNREDSCEEGNIKLDKEGNNMDESNIQESSVEEINVEVSLTQSDETSEKEIPSISENSDDTKQETISVTPTEIESIEKNETNSDEVLKKLNERAARFSKELNDSKKKDENVNPEPKSPREEGELTPVLETKKSKHTTIVINRPKEVTSQPTKLKRNTDDLPPSERKRRLVLKPKPKDKEEDPFNISSQSLMLLVPEVKTITPEQVASFPLDDEDLSKFEMEQPSEIINKKKINLKPKDVEIRVQNENRQVVKKKQIIIDATNEVDEMKAVGPKLPLQENHRVVRKISLLTEDVKKARRSPSPSGNPATEVLFITNLVRPFTIPQLRELLARTGTIASNGFYIDKIKSKCYVKYTDIEMAVETRHALNGVRWPVNNPKMLKVEFATPEDMALVQKLAEDEVTVKKPETAEPVTAATAGWLSEQAALKPQRRVTTAVREWDMGKVGMGAAEEKRQVEEWPVKPELPEVKRRAASPVENKYEPPARKIKKRDNDAPARLLDDLFRKTKATPCIYWLPLTAAQIAVKEEMRRQHMAEHERRLAELRKSDHSRRDKDREKSRDSRRKK